MIPPTKYERNQSLPSVYYHSKINEANQHDVSKKKMFSSATCFTVDQIFMEYWEFSGNYEYSFSWNNENFMEIYVNYYEISELLI